MRRFFGNFKLSNWLSNWRISAGVLAILFGLVLSWQALSVQAYSSIGSGSDDSRDLKAKDREQNGYSVRSEVSDQTMFGKSLSTERIAPALATSELKPGSGPVVPARLRIPALGIDTNIESVGLRNGNIDVPSNIWNAGWLDSSVRPGDKGTAIIDGHKDSVRGVAIFWNLDRLQAGDKIYVSDEYGWELTFEVSQVESYDLHSAPLDRVLGANQTDAAHLNLISCTGTFVAQQHTYDQRVVVYTKLIG